jgi:MFS family permease
VAPLKKGNRSVDSAWSWLVACAAFVVLFLAYGNAYTFGVFFPALASEFNADRAETALVFSLVGGLYSTLGIVSGPAADRFGTRPVCLFGMLAMAAGLIFASTADALWQVYIGFGLGGALGMGFTFAPANAGLQRWFTRRRGLASGLASSGIGISIMLLPPLVAWLIDWRDWRAAMLVLGISVATAGSLAALFLGDPPGTKLARSTPTPGANQFDLKRALTSRGFVVLYLSSMFCCVGLFIPFVHLVPYAIDQGIGDGAGVFLVALIGASSLIGRVLLTAASDRFSRRGSLAAMYLGMGLSFLFWYAGGNMVMLSVFAGLFGICYGGYVGMVGPIVAEYFGTQKIGSVLGCYMSSIAIGGFFGPLLAGHAFDLWGSYDVPILIAAAFSLLAGLFALLMPARPGAAGATGGEGG